MALFSNHVLVAAPLGVVAPNVATAALAGFVSHFVFDAAPHYGRTHLDPHAATRVAEVDGLLSVAIAVTAVACAPTGHRSAVAGSIVGTLLPDSEKPLLYFTGKARHPRWFARVHHGIQREHRHLSLEMAAGIVLAAGAAAVYAWSHQRAYRRRFTQMWGLPQPQARRPRRSPRSQNCGR